MFNIFKNKEKKESKEGVTDNINEDFDIEESEEVTTLDDFLDNTNIQGIYPFSWEEFPDHIESGGNYIRVLTIAKYPNVKSGNWLSELKRKKGNITIVQSFESNNAQQMVDYYDRTIKNKEAKIIDTHDPLRRKKLEKAIETANMQMSKYLDSEAMYVYQSMYVFIQASSLSELEAHIKYFRNFGFNDPTCFFSFRICQTNKRRKSL